MTEEQTNPAPRAPGWLPAAHFSPLRPAEQVLLRAYLAGDIARVGLRRPLLPSAGITIRGDFVAYLARTSPHENFRPRRVQIVGAWIEGGIDLRNATVPEAIWFYRCVFDATPRLDGARVGASVSFPGCLLPGLRADDCTVAGNLALNSGCTVRTEVRLARARIGRDLNLEGLQLRSNANSDTPIQRRMSAEGARIDGHVLMQGGLEADGDLYMVGLRVAGDLRASDARVSGDVDSQGRHGDALNLDHARIAGHVMFDRRFSATGLVRLNQAQIGGDLDCSGATFDALGELALRGDTTLSLERLRVGATLTLSKQARPLHRASLAGARAMTLVDDETTWGEGLVIDGFVYQRFGKLSAADGGSRLRWLMRQSAEHLGVDFRPQPWRQLIKVLRQAGHHVAAREAAVALEAHWLRIGRVGAGAPRGLRWLARTAHRLFGALVGYGYRPQRLIAAMAVLWLASGALYWVAAEYGAIAPSNPAVYNDPRYANCRGDGAAAEQASWMRCAALPVEQTAFRPFAYSLEMLLPFVDLRQRNQWTAIDDHRADARHDARSTASRWGVASRVLSWYETFVGWLALALLALLALRMFDRDR
jgi:hypothetical protein